MNPDDREVADLLAGRTPPETVAPLIRLASEALDLEQLTAPLRHHRPHALVDGAGTDVLSALSRLARDLNACDTRLTFPRYGFVSWLVQEDLGPARRESRLRLLSDELTKRLKERRPYSRRDPVAPLSGAQSTVQLVLVIVAHFLPALGFRLWKRGLVGRDTRWIMRQRFLAPADAGGFAEFAISLTKGRRREADGHELELLLTHAFLEDLRIAFRRVPWRRTGRPVLLAADAAGERVLDLITEVRAATGEADPVVPITLAPDGPAACRTLRLTRAPVTRVPVRRRPPIVAVTLVGILTYALVPAPPEPAARSDTPVAAPCGTTARVVPWVSPDGDRECVGFSGDRSHVFGNPVDGQDAEQVRQNLRLQRDQEQIFDENARAGLLRSSTRPVTGLVYFAGLTAGRDDDYDSAEAEELEGLLVAQRRADVSSVNAPLLRVVIANGGSKMRDAAAVAGMLVREFARDRTLLGVVGLDRSVTATATAIGLLDAAGIPTLATTLSADGIDRDANGRPLANYFALSPGNRSEARDILRYVRDAVPAYFRRRTYDSAGKARPTRTWIYRPPGSADGDDLYIATLVRDLGGESAGDADVKVTTSLGPALCGASSAIVYAGRHDRPAGKDAIDDFSLFLTSIAGRCRGDLPFIVADDGITRFVADPGRRLRSDYQGIEISYVSKGIDVLETGNACVSPAAAGARRPLTPPMRTFCEAYLSVARDLRRDLGITLLWTGERAGLAYDAAEMFLQAAADIRDTHEAPPGAPPARGRIRTTLETTPYTGITGTFDYRRSHIPADTPGRRPLAVVRILISAGDSLPTCEYPGRGDRTTGPGPNTGDCP